MQGNIHTCPECTSHASQMHPAHVPDTSRLRSGRVLRLEKKGMVVNEVLLQLYCEVLCLHGYVLCAFSHSGRVLHVLQTHANVTLELSCAVL